MPAVPPLTVALEPMVAVTVLPVRSTATLLEALITPPVALRVTEPDPLAAWIAGALTPAVETLPAVVIAILPGVLARMPMAPSPVVVTAPVVEMPMAAVGAPPRATMPSAPTPVVATDPAVIDVTPDPALVRMPIAPSPLVETELTLTVTVPEPEPASMPMEPEPMVLTEPIVRVTGPLPKSAFTPSALIPLVATVAMLAVTGPSSDCSRTPVAPSPSVVMLTPLGPSMVMAPVGLDVETNRPVLGVSASTATPLCRCTVWSPALV